MAKKQKKAVKKKNSTKLTATDMSERKQLYVKMVRQLTTLSTLLAGFSLTNMTILLTRTSTNAISNMNIISVSLATYLFIGATVLGSYINFRLVLIKRIEDPEEDTIFSKFMDVFFVLLALSAGGTFCFILSVFLIPFHMGLVIGIICAIMATPIFGVMIHTINRIDIVIKKMR